jgi:dTDP-4-dehydrorhamnose reductase
VLITGAGGLVGSAAARVFATDTDVVAAGRRELDVTDESAVERALDAHRPDLVVHAAAFTDVDGAEAAPEEADRVNHRAAATVARACAARGAVLFALSTDYVFDGALERPYREDDPPRPLSVYGRTKLLGEEAVRAAGGAHLVVRAQALYGHGRRRHFVAKLLAMRDATEEIAVVDDRTSQPTFADDLARALLRLFWAGARGLCHVANTGPVTWYRFALLVREESGFPKGRLRPIASRERGERAPRPRSSVLDTSRYASLAGEPMPSVREGLRRYLASVGMTRA